MTLCRMSRSGMYTMATGATHVHLHGVVVSDSTSKQTLVLD